MEESRIPAVRVSWIFSSALPSWPIFKESFCEDILLHFPETKIEILTVSPEIGALNIARGLYE